ncbi:2-oxo acid dehydrogenase subunit E2 [Salinibacterium sp. dk2585]|uniref:dihydrolipoamide acetyltransferase family protein n=1 Tax=unclassified Salinibacterium TaxID=2632331 RepID=UPI0011C25078|nr:MULTISPECIES: dihydrolipoamide acetyltransferase family protein [unclassified Salinibacterium]QEE61488.1 2-oxo acid dehydrogenase subunit E2 [Salinibacterium sp. dk2585]TXK54165.1 2-oxo acid dehydrogenase subunit E2 [Salinibacterium sp. dk5596]
MSVQEFALPDLGEGLTESEIVSWEVDVGDTVELNQVLAEVETAKALVELPSPFAGTISQLLVEPGTTVRVGTPIITIETADAGGLSLTVEVPPISAEPPDAAESIPDAPEPPPAPPTPTPPETPPAPERTSVLVGYGPKVASAERPRRRHRREEWLASRSDAAEEPQRASDAAPRDPNRSPLGARGSDTRVPIAGVRRRMAEAMVHSAFTAPHASLRLDVDVTESLGLVERLKRHPRLEGTRVGFLTIAAAACLSALRTSPAINSRWDAERDEVVEFAHVGLGIAVATDRGLLVPHIHDADRLSFVELASAMTELVTKAREATTTPAQLAGGTFTITNVGVFGVDAGTPILPPGEAAILALGAVRKRPWEHEGEVALRSVVSLTLSFDHRLVDGRQGSEFLTAVGDILGDPSSVLAYR